MSDSIPLINNSSPQVHFIIFQNICLITTLKFCNIFMLLETAGCKNVAIIESRKTFVLSQKFLLSGIFKCIKL